MPDTFTDLLLNSDPSTSPRLLRLIANGVDTFTLTNGRDPDDSELEVINAKAQVVERFENCACDKVENEDCDCDKAKETEDDELENMVCGPSCAMGVCDKVSNARFALPEDGYIQLVPKGEFMHNPTGIRQICDDESIRSIVQNFNIQKQDPNFAGLLLDRDHKSQSGESTALAWITEVQQRDTGVWGKPALTAEGEKAILGGDLRMISPVFKRSDLELVDKATNSQRPKKIDSCGATNDPNMDVVPMTRIVA